MSHVKIVDRDLGWAELFKVAAEIKDARVKIGVLADTAKGGEREHGGTLTVAEIAAILEFGTANQNKKDGLVIPPRPFLRSTFEEKREELVKLGKELIEKALAGKVSVDQALNIMGASLANSVKRKITSGEGVPPPDAPATIKAKGSSRPIVDTSRLVNAITWAIAKKGEGEEP